MVFQSFNLWSHMTVLQNVIEAPVHVLKRPKAEAIDYADEILQKVGLYDRRDYYPAHLSGGQQQRVAIARALARSEEHTSELQSLMRISYAVFCLKKKTQHHQHHIYHAAASS